MTVGILANKWPNFPYSEVIKKNRGLGLFRSGKISLRSVSYSLDKNDPFCQSCGEDYWCVLGMCSYEGQERVEG